MMKLRYHSDSSSFNDNADEDLDSVLLSFNLTNLIERLQCTMFEEQIIQPFHVATKFTQM